jgi:hypothetical protein
MSRPAILVETSVYPGADDCGFACPGRPGMSVAADSDVTVCFFISNSGDTPLTDLTLVDSVLDVTIDDLNPVIGDPSAVLAPGESIMLSFETTADANIRTRTTVTGTPSEPEGTRLDAQAVANTVSIAVTVEDPDGITSFSDGLRESWELLVSLAQLMMLAVAWLLPFSWLIPLVWWLRRRNAGKTPNTPPPAAAPEPERQPETV